MSSLLIKLNTTVNIKREIGIFNDLWSLCSLDGEMPRNSGWNPCQSPFLSTLSSPPRIDTWQESDEIRGGDERVDKNEDGHGFQPEFRSISPSKEHKLRKSLNMGISRLILTVVFSFSKSEDKCNWSLVFVTVFDVVQSPFV